MSWVLPWSDFGLCVLKANPCCRNPKKQPRRPKYLPDIDSNETAKKQTAGVAWIAETFVLPLAETIPAAAAIGAKQPKP